MSSISSRYVGSISVSAIHASTTLLPIVRLDAFQSYEALKTGVISLGPSRFLASWPNLKVVQGMRARVLHVNGYLGHSKHSLGGIRAVSRIPVRAVMATCYVKESYQLWRFI